MTNTFTKEKLDRLVDNVHWSKLYNSIRVENLVSRCSNHKPLMVSCNNQPYGMNRRGRLFKLEASWNLEKGFGAWVNQYWKNWGGQNNPVSKVQQQLDECQKSLWRWSSLVHRGRAKDIRYKSKKLKDLQDLEDPSALEDINQLQKELHLLLDQQDLKWKQKIKRHWYRNGD